ncbi:hypothetical protein AVEN_250488-1 [Araneus ventricosus]|uniref:Uncharacterized protein n=1 Tax=Araneus ventricosus TaxID=182803 RepID=A0A4Y2QW14_ARAVE|nr:hypothetical protein AVEN_250488-1 [Araneus ventricosus]
MTSSQIRSLFSRISALHKGGTLKPPSPGLEHVDVINEDLNDITEQVFGWPSSSSMLVKKANAVNTSRTAFHLVFCSRQLDALTSLAMAAPSTGTWLVAHIIRYKYYVDAINISSVL